MDTVSQSSSNQALHQQIMQTQLIPTSQISPVEAATPRRGFLGNVFGSRSRPNTAIGPEIRNNGKLHHILCAGLVVIKLQKRLRPRHRNAAAQSQTASQLRIAVRS